jgi:hypothetical protein
LSEVTPLSSMSSSRARPIDDVIDDVIDDARWARAEAEAAWL